MSVFYLYFNSGLKPNDNFAYHNSAGKTLQTAGSLVCPRGVISPSYTWGATPGEPFQYQRIEVDMEVKIDLAEAYAGQAYDYAQISQDNFVYGFFVTKIKQVHEYCLRLSLHLDVLNTFDPFLNNMFDPRTHITRQHKARYVVDYQTKFVKIVDKFDEGLNPPLYKTSDTTLPGIVNNADRRAYLIYKSDDAEAIKAYVTTNFDLTISAASSIKQSDLAQNAVYAILVSDGHLTMTLHTISYGDVTITLGSNASFIDDIGNNHTGIREGLLLSNRASPSEFVARLMVTTYPKGHIPTDIDLPNSQRPTSTFQLSALMEQFNINSVTGIDIVSGSGVLRKTTLTSMDGSDLFYSYILEATTTETKIGTPQPIKAINDPTFDRADPTLIKIIELPDWPLPLGSGDSFSTTGAQNLSLPAGTHLESDALRIDDLDMKFTQKAYQDTLTELASISPVVDSHTGEFKRMDDPKILNSAFYKIKIVYDNFAYDLALEDYSLNGNYYQSVVNSTALRIDETFSSNINSRTAFYPTLVNIGTAIYTFTGKQDFNVLLATRNNEYPIYNNEYLNYIKTGYNYDKKIKSQQESFTWAMAGANAVGALLSLIAGGPVGTAAAIGQGVALVSNVASVAHQQSINTQALEQKLNTLKMQSANVAGTDDLSLFNDYSKNKLHIIKYEPEHKVAKMLDDLFYFYGYRCDTYGIPNVKTRRLFNFIQCYPVWVNETQANNLYMRNDFLEEYGKKLMEGVTFFHPYRENSFKTLDPKFENIETAVWSDYWAANP